MKVLFTSSRANKGVHASEVAMRGSDCATPALLDALSYDHEYDIRAVDVGENLDHYDAIVVTLTNAAVQGNDTLYGALWACVQGWTGGPPVIVHFDHFTIKDIVKSYVNFTRHPDKLLDGFITFKDADRARPYQDLLLMQCYRWSTCVWEPTVTCAFEWGDHRKLVKGLDGILEGFDFTYDPSYLHVDICNDALPVKFDKWRAKKWIFGGIADHEKWMKSLKLKWPVELYGMPRLGRPFIPRNSLIDLYAYSWGAMSPPYYNVGSGYWRARHVHYAMAGCVNLCDAREIPYPVFALRTDLIESLLQGDLAGLADDQSNWMLSHFDPKDDVHERIIDFFEAIDKRDRVNEIGGPRPKFIDPNPQPTRLL